MIDVSDSATRQRLYEEHRRFKTTYLSYRTMFALRRYRDAPVSHPFMQGLRGSSTDNPYDPVKDLDGYLLWDCGKGLQNEVAAPVASVRQTWR